MAVMLMGRMPAGRARRNARAVAGWQNSHRSGFSALGHLSIPTRGAAFDISEVAMSSRTNVPGVAAVGPRAVGSMRNKRRRATAKSARVDGLSRALAGAIEMLEQRWLLSGEGLQGSYFEAPNNLGYDK